MPAPERNHVQVVRCKGIGCGRNVPTPVEVQVRTSPSFAPSVWNGGPRRGMKDVERQNRAVSTLAHSVRRLRQGHAGTPVQGAR